MTRRRTHWPRWMSSAVGRRFASRLERLSPADPHTLQANWYAGAGAGAPGVVRAQRLEEVVSTEWPVRPELSAAADLRGGMKKAGPLLRTGLPGGRYWVRTSDLFGVNEALSH